MTGIIIAILIIVLIVFSIVCQMMKHRRYYYEADINEVIDEYNFLVEKTEEATNQIVDFLNENKVPLTDKQRSEILQNIQTAHAVLWERKNEVEKLFSLHGKKLRFASGLALDHLYDYREELSILSMTNSYARKIWDDYRWQSRVEDAKKEQYQQATTAHIQTPIFEDVTGFFQGCDTKNDIKKRYRELTKLHHPDNGGDSDKFFIITQEYERKLAFLKKALCLILFCSLLICSSMDTANATAVITQKNHYPLTSSRAREQVVQIIDKTIKEIQEGKKSDGGYQIPISSLPITTKNEMEELIYYIYRHYSKGFYVDLNALEFYCRAIKSGNTLSIYYEPMRLHELKSESIHPKTIQKKLKKLKITKKTPWKKALNKISLYIATTFEYTDDSIWEMSLREEWRQKKVVCHGIASLFYAFAKESGFQVHYVETKTHAFNYIIKGKKKYYYDVSMAKMYHTKTTKKTKKNLILYEKKTVITIDKKMLCKKNYGLSKKIKYDFCD